MTRRIDQLLAGYAEGDAISRDARRIRDVFRKMGLAGDLFAPGDRIAEGCEHDCCALDQYAGAADNVLIYHYSIRSPEEDIYARTPAKKIVKYHNITPARFFRGVDDGVASRLADARAGLGAVVRRADAVVADSAYNAAEITELGVSNVGVMPLFFSPDNDDVPPDEEMLEKLGPPLRNVLFVGRMAPNKCVEDLILAFGWLHACMDSAFRLVLVGSDRSCPRYFALLRMLAGRLDARNVCFEGFLSESQLSACYKRADVFVCASRHEGYCLPLLEAMSHNVPVVARRACAMPETMDGAGLLFEGNDPKALGELLYTAATDSALRSRVLDGQQQRVEQLRRRDLVAECEALLDRVS
jgi:glycosyltransferase involved in cell wall biosynthesis